MSVHASPRPKSEQHREAARARWGPQRVVNLTELDADTARLIRALIAQTEAQKADGGDDAA